ncbi:MAG: hypothetical protein QM296_03875 [Bacillota bacterium]|nr:hypothetical protein [Bacillota bacterium]
MRYTRKRTGCLLLFLIFLMSCNMIVTRTAAPEENSTPADGKRENFSFYYGGKHLLDEGLDAIYFISNHFLYRAAKPLVPGQAELLSLDARSLEAILSNSSEVEKHDAYFGRAVGVFCTRDHLHVLHENPENTGIEQSHLLTALSTDGGQRRVIAELNGLTGHCWRQDDRLYLTRYAHDSENQRSVELISLKLSSGDVQVHAEIQLMAFVDLAGDPSVQDLFVDQNHAYVSLHTLPDMEGMQRLYLLVDLGSGSVRDVVKSVERSTGQQILSIKPYQDGILLQTADDVTDVHSAAYCHTADWRATNRTLVRTGRMGELVLSDGHNRWLRPSEAVIWCHTHDEYMSPEVHEALLQINPYPELLNSAFESTGRALPGPSGGWPDFHIQFAFTADYGLALCHSTGDVFFAALPADDQQTSMFEPLLQTVRED